MGIIFEEAKSWQAREVMEIKRKKKDIASTSWTMRIAVMSIGVCLCEDQEKDEEVAIR